MPLKSSPIQQFGRNAVAPTIVTTGLVVQMPLQRSPIAHQRSTSPSSTSSFVRPSLLSSTHCHSIYETMQEETTGRRMMPSPPLYPYDPSRDPVAHMQRMEQLQQRDDYFQMSKERRDDSQPETAPVDHFERAIYAVLGPMPDDSHDPAETLYSSKGPSPLESAQTSP